MFCDGLQYSRISVCQHKLHINTWNFSKVLSDASQSLYTVFNVFAHQCDCIHYWKNLYGVGKSIQHGRMQMECDTLYMVLGMYTLWEKEYNIGQRLWSQWMCIVWDRTYGVAQYIYYDRRHVVWKNVHGVGDLYGTLDLLPWHNLYFQMKKIQTEKQNFLFCRWKQQVKMSCRYLSPKLHGVTSQKTVIDMMIYVTRVNRKVLHGAVRL